MKDVELKLVSELMRNGKRSDRDLARTIGVSCPTVTRLRSRLERQGYAGEYKFIPNFHRLGYEIMAFSFIKYTKELSSQESEELIRAVREAEEKMSPRSVTMIMNGIGIGSDSAVVSIHMDYASFVQFTALLRQFPFVDVDHVESFLISLRDDSHYLPSAFTTLARHLLELNGENNGSRRPSKRSLNHVV